MKCGMFVLNLFSAGDDETRPRAHRANESAGPSKTPVSITQNLSELRLTHARLLEEHGASLALLRSREAELADAERRDAESRLTIEDREENIRALTDKIGRREHRAALAEREVGFLTAWVVGIFFKHFYF